MESNVKSLLGKDNYSIDAVKTWVKAMGDKGIYAPNTARIRISAIDVLIAVLGEDEPCDAQSVLDSLDDLATRWATLNNGTPNTAKTYKSRARVALEDFLKFQLEPGSFKPRTRAATRARSDESKPKAKAKRTAEPKNAGAPNEAGQSSGTDEAADSTQTMRDFPLKGGRRFLYQLPAEGMDVRDVLKVALHLLTFAEDFDPTNPMQAQMFALAKAEDQ